MYNFCSRVVLRTPSEAFCPNLSLENLNDYLEGDAKFKEALYLASPSLYAQIQNIETQSLFSLAKYILRNRTRSTPFGLFAGLGTVKWKNEETKIVIKEEYKRFTRLDMTYLCALSRGLESDYSIKKHLNFYPNSSIYKVANSLRYTEYDYKDGRRVYQMSSVENNFYLDEILKFATSGSTIEGLAAKIVNDEINLEEAEAFINDLIHAQLLVSEIEPTVTGLDFLDKLIRVLKRIDSPILSILVELKSEISFLDNGQINDKEVYKTIEKRIESLGVSFDESKLFQVDKLSLFNTNILSESFKVDLLKTIKRLSVFSKENTNLNLFKKRFLTRYENREVPLLEVLDSEFGIGYLENESQVFSPLVEDLKLLNKKEKTVEITSLEQKLFKRLLKANINKEYELSLESIDLEEEVLNTGPSISVIFRSVNEKQIFLESVSGASATNLLARFGQSSEEIADLLTEIVQHENESNPNVIFAEIVHLPESRTGNILFRPAFRKYEIPFLAQAENEVISLQDLYISVQNNRVVLRYKDFEIIPRLGTAHNYSYKSLPIYHFLCDLQGQNIQTNFGFSWGNLKDEFLFLPRVVDQNVIVSLATWQVASNDLLNLKSDFKSFAENHKLPQYFVLAEADNELFVDSNNKFLLDIFLNSIKNKENIVLKEFLLDENTPIKNEEGKTMANQFIATLFREDSVYNSVKPVDRFSEVKRSFLPGSEWLYFKIFCGAKTADVVLLEVLKPMIAFLRNKKVLKKWFFIRYNEPSNHIRFRVNLNEKADFTKIFRVFETLILPFKENGMIAKVEVDTYERELERYGFDAIEKAESFFCIDSESYLQFIELNQGDAREEQKSLYAFKKIDDLLKAAGFSLETKFELLQKMRNDFASEFGMNQNLKSQLDKKYREKRVEIDAVLNRNNSEVNTYLKDLVQFKSKEIIYSYIHMLVNRIFSDKQRVHELVIYDFLFRYYKSQIARKARVE